MKANKTFDTFIVDPSNQFAFAACKSVCSNDAEVYNPLIIYGPTACGKTHLLMAIQNQIRSDDFDYYDVDLLVSGYIELCKQQVDVNKTLLNNCMAGVVLIEGLEYLLGRPETQKAFVQFLNLLYECGKKVVITSSIDPNSLECFSEAFKDSFPGGLFCSIAAPTLEIKQKYFQRIIDEHNLRFDVETREYLSRNASDIRVIDGVAKKLHMLGENTITIKQACKIVKEVDKNER